MSFSLVVIIFNLDKEDSVANGKEEANQLKTVNFNGVFNSCKF